jgi:hypothetical protein
MNQEEAHSGQHATSRIVGDPDSATSSLVETAVYDAGHSVAGCALECGGQLDSLHLFPSWKNVHEADLGEHVVVRR